MLFWTKLGLILSLWFSLSDNYQTKCAHIRASSTEFGYMEWSYIGHKVKYFWQSCLKLSKCSNFIEDFLAVFTMVISACWVLYFLPKSNWNIVKAFSVIWAAWLKNETLVDVWKSGVKYLVVNFWISCYRLLFRGLRSSPPEVFL